jgi:hypothetical protein
MISCVSSVSGDRAAIGARGASGAAAPAVSRTWDFSDPPPALAGPHGPVGLVEILSEQFKPAPWTYRPGQWQADDAVIRGRSEPPCSTWDAASSSRCSAARRRLGRWRRARSSRRRCRQSGSSTPLRPSLPRTARVHSATGYIEGENVAIELGRESEGEAAIAGGRIGSRRLV